MISIFDALDINFKDLEANLQEERKYLFTALSRFRIIESVSLHLYYNVIYRMQIKSLVA